MTRDVTPNFKTPKATVSESANQRRGRINRQSGKRKQSAALRVLEAVYEVQAKWAGSRGNEETWHHLPVRAEIKSGAQVGPIATRYLAAEKQSEQARATGDTRPFVFIAMPAGMSDGLLVVRLSVFAELMQ